MKRIISIMTVCLISLPGITQNEATAAGSPQQEKMTAGEESVSLMSLRIGDRGIEILEMLEEGPKVAFRRYDSFGVSPFQDEEKERDRSRSSRRFKGHWGGLEIGFNNFLTADYSMVIPNDIYYMSLNSGKSKNVNINFGQINLGITRGIGFVTGLGINMHNYFFEGNNNIMKGAGGVIEPLYPNAGLTYEKSKLATSYLTAPFLLEIQVPAGYSKHVNIAAGPIGAVKIGSHSKTVFYSEGKQKVKDHSDFSLNMLRYGFTGRVGFEMVQFYGTYYMTPLFKEGKGPELYPFEIGVSFTFND